MRTRALAGTEIRTTELGFGCARLLSAGARERLRILEAAYDAGIRHFDVAPMYGLGAAERELGKFAARRRDQLVLATKFGIEPGRGTKRLAAVQAPARRLLAAAPALRRFVRSRSSALYAPSRYDPEAARVSLDRSLQALGTDYVDLFLVHEPQPGALPAESLVAHLESEREAGRILAWGLAGEPDATAAVARELRAPPPVVQTRDHILARSTEAADGIPPTITFGALAGALEPIVGHVSADRDRRTRWSEAVGVDCGRAELVAPLLLRDALAANATGVVLFSTTKPSRVTGLAEAIAAAEGSLEAFVGLVEQELRVPRPELA